MDNIKFKHAEMKFVYDDKQFDMNGGRTILDFWQWAYSDLVQNITRGYIAQFIVSWMVGEDRLAPNKPWQPFDVQIPKLPLSKIQDIGSFWLFAEEIT